jgi:putative integral membrane protein (TIGR02587 family)
MNFSHENSVVDSLREYGRGLAGGLIFALPLLFTMELWDAALMTSPEKLGLYLATTFCLLLLYNRYAGLRSDATFTEVAIDSVEELGLGIVIAFALLFLLGRVDGENTWPEIMNSAILQGMTLAIGVSVGTAQLGTGDDDGNGGMDEDKSKGGVEYNYLAQSAIAVCGAVLFAANIAPTDEIGVIAREASIGMLVTIMIFSMLLGLSVLYFAAFRGSKQHLPERKWTWMTREILTAYAAALAASAYILYFFGSLPTDTPLQFVAGMIVVGLPATLGASAGRLLLQLDH